MNGTQLEPRMKRIGHTGYSGLSYLENDMIFLKTGSDLRPEKWSFAKKTTGIFSNHFLANGGTYGEFASFEHEFNKWLRNLSTGWYEHNVNEIYSPQDEFRRVLSFTGVEERLSRHNGIDSTSGAYSGLTRQSDEARELTYKYKFNSQILVEYMKHITQNKPWSTHKYSDDKLWIDDNINNLNAAKFIRFQLNRFFEIKKQEIWNKYSGSFYDYTSTEFSDVVASSDNYGMMFFIDHETATNDIGSKFPPQKADYDTTAVWDNTEYDDSGSGDINEDRVLYDKDKYDDNSKHYDYVEGRDNPDLFDDSNDNDLLGSVNTSLWFAPFDISEISMTNYMGDEFVEVTIMIPEGIAYNNKAKVMQLATLNKPNGESVELKDSASEFKTYQIDGLFHNGIPKEQIALMTIEQTSKLKRISSAKTLTVIGSDTWFDEQKVIDDVPQDASSLGKNDVPFIVSSNLKYQLLHPYSVVSGERGYILPSIFNKKTAQSKIGSLNRVKYRGTGFKVKNAVMTSALGKKVTRFVPAPPINIPLQWFDIHGGYDNTGPHYNVILGGSPNPTMYGNFPLSVAHANGVGQGIGFEVINNILTVRLNLVGYSVDDSGNYVTNARYVSTANPYRYKVRLEWRQNGVYNTFKDDFIFSHDSSWYLAYAGNWLQTAQNSQWSSAGLTVPENADNIRVTIYGEDATQVESTNYDVTPYRPPVPIEEIIPLNINMSDYDIQLGVIAREIRHI